jgi:hypothetical protein
MGQNLRHREGDEDNFVSDIAFWSCFWFYIPIPKPIGTCLFLKMGGFDFPIFLSSGTGNHIATHTIMVLVHEVISKFTVTRSINIKLYRSILNRSI